MSLVLVQLVLIVGVTLVGYRLVMSPGQRTQAIRRLGWVLLVGVAIASILFPQLWTNVARLVGVGRGADLILYALVVAFLSSTLTTYLRYRALEQRFTKLARRIALDEAGPASPAPAVGQTVELPSDTAESRTKPEHTG